MSRTGSMFRIILLDQTDVFCVMFLTPVPPSSLCRVPHSWELLVYCVQSDLWAQAGPYDHVK